MVVEKTADSDVVAALAGSEDVAGGAGGDPTDEGAGGAVADALFTDGPYTWDHGDGQTTEITGRAQLTDVLKHSMMRNSDLEVERRGYAEKQKVLDEAMNQARGREAKAQKTEEEWLAVNKAMERYPGLRNQIEGLVKSFSSGSRSVSQPDLLEAAMQSPEVKEIVSRLDSMEERFKVGDTEKAERQFVVTREEAAKALSEEFSDFDSKAVTAELDRLRDAPQQDLQRLLMRTAYHSLLGQQRMGELEARKAGDSRGERPSARSTPGSVTQSAVSAPDGEDEDQVNTRVLSALKRVPEEAE